MGRRRIRSDPARAAPDVPNSPFAALKPLRGALPAHHDKPAATAPRRTAATETEDEARLFRAAMSGVHALKSPNRAELERPRPAPVPRPRPAAEEREPAAAPAPAPDDDAAALRAALADVRPLKDSGRIEPGATPARAAPRAGGGQDWEAVLPRLLDTVPQDDTALFDIATRGARPLKDKGRIAPQVPPPAPEPRQRQEDERATLREALEAPLTIEDRLDMGDEAVFLRDGLPRRVLTDLRRGRWVVQGELDLHGLTRDQAREALALFVAQALQRGLRCVRLIHGKGLGSPGRVPVLKHLSRGWLAQRDDILAFCQARPHDGGEGALLVLLRALAGPPHRD